MLQAAVFRTAGAALLAIVMAGLVVYGTFRIARIADGHLLRKIGKVGIKNYELVREERVRDVFRGCCARVGGLVLLAIALAFLSYSLGQFPWTRGTSAGLVSLIIGPLQTMAQGVVRQIPNLIFLAIFFVVVRFILRITRLLFEGIGRGFVTSRTSNRNGRRRPTRSRAWRSSPSAIIVAYPYIPGSDSDSVQGRLALRRHPVLARVVVGDRQHHRRLHVDLSPRVQGR